MQIAKIAILDDEKDIINSLKELLVKRGHKVQGFEHPDALFKYLSKEQPHMLFLDINLGYKVPSGLEVLRKVRQRFPQIEVVMISGVANVKEALEVLKLGAKDLLEKPLSPQAIFDAVIAAIGRLALNRERDTLLDEVLTRYEILGDSIPMMKLKEQITQYSKLNETILITGESGSGKELVAANLHYLSSRRQQRYYKINMASLPESLLEAQLFGHTKGAYSGAEKSSSGLFLAACDSTLFLDEIGELKYELQPKLLRAIQEKEILPVGSSEVVPVDVRLVFATNRNLEEQVAQQKFREDLYYRISTLTIAIPPLREHKEDIPLLAQNFLEQFCFENNLSFKEISTSAIEKLQSYSYPGNIRELKNIIIQAIVQGRNHYAIKADDIHFPTHTPLKDPFTETMALNLMKKKLEKQYIETQLRLHNFDLQKTALALNILVNNLYRKIKELDIHIP